MWSTTSRTTTGGHLHLLVATHEHLDHVSGFRSQMAKFKGMTIDHVWLAWTEDPTDPDREEDREVQERSGRGAHRASRGRSVASPQPAMGQAMAGVLGFFDDTSSAPGLGAGKFAPTVDEAMEFVRTGTAPAKTCYNNPGDGPLEESWLPGFRIFVLGPPRDETKLNNLGEHGSSRAVFAGRGARAGGGACSHPASPSEPSSTAAKRRTEFEASLPFDVRYRRARGSVPTQSKMFAALSREGRRVAADRSTTG